MSSLGLLELGPASALRGGDAGAAFFAHFMTSFFRNLGFGCRLRSRFAFGSLAQSGAQLSHLGFNVLQLVLITDQCCFERRLI